jgi:hypothetical protein
LGKEYSIVSKRNFEILERCKQRNSSDFEAKNVFNLQGLNKAKVKSFNCK